MPPDSSLPLSAQNVSGRCMAELVVADTATPAFHLCDRGPRHAPPHRCDVCGVEWNDGDDPLPIAEPEETS